MQAPFDRVFTLFEQTDNACAALSSVRALFGNRHLCLEWAHDPDLADAIFSLTNDGRLGAQDKASVSAQSTFPRWTSAK